MRTIQRFDSFTGIMHKPVREIVPPIHSARFYLSSAQRYFGFFDPLQHFPERNIRDYAEQRLFAKLGAADPG